MTVHPFPELGFMLHMARSCNNTRPALDTALSKHDSGDQGRRGGVVDKVEVDTKTVII